MKPIVWTIILILNNCQLVSNAPTFQGKCYQDLQDSKVYNSSKECLEAIKKAGINGMCAAQMVGYDWPEDAK